MKTPHPNRLAFRIALYQVAGTSGMEAAFPAASNNYVRFGRLAGESDIGVSVTQQRARITLNNRGADAQPAFQNLRAQRESIDAAVGHKLNWDDVDLARQKTVVRATVDGGYRSDRQGWADQHCRIIELVRAFQQTFTNRF